MTSNIYINPSDIIELNGPVVASSNVTVGGDLNTLGDIQGTDGNIMIGNILTDGYRWANGMLVDFGGGTTDYSNANVANYLPVYGGTLLVSNISMTSSEISLGNNSGGGTGHGPNIVAIGQLAGTGNANSVNTNFYVAIGEQAGSLGTGANSVSVGHQAGYENIGEDSIAIGHNAGNSHGVIPGSNTIAIGTNAGFATQASNSIAIGTNAGYANMANNSILLNATGANLASNYAGFYVAPIRTDDANITNSVYFNAATNELLVGPLNSGGGNTVYGNAQVEALLESGTLGGNIIPGGNGVYSLGNATNQWSNVWITGNTLYLSAVPIGLNAGHQLTVDGFPAATYDALDNLTANGFVGNTVQAQDFNWANGVPLLANGQFNGNVVAPLVTSNAVAANVITSTIANLTTINSGVINNTGLLTTGTLVANTSVTSNTILANSLFVTKDTHLGAVGNVFITGGSAGQVLGTDGTGNLSWGTVAAGYANSNVANFLPNYTGNIGKATSFASNIYTTTLTANIIEVTSAGTIEFAEGANIKTIPTGGLGGTLGINGTNNRGVSVVAGGNVPGQGYAQIQWVEDVANYDPYSAANSITNWAYVQDDGLYMEVIDDKSVDKYNYSINLKTDGNINTNANLVSVANISTTGFFLGDGGLLTNVAASYSNADVANYLPNYNGNLNNINTINALTLKGNGANITAINGANVTGFVANATRANTAVTVTNNAQPNITSVGTLTTLTVAGTIGAGNITGGNLVTANFFSGDGHLLTNITVSTGNVIVNGNSNVSVAANGNVTFGVSGNANVVVIDGVYATGNFTGNITGNASTANLVIGSISDGNIPTLASTGNLVDSTKYFSDAFTTNLNYWSALQTEAYVTQALLNVPSLPFVDCATTANVTKSGLTAIDGFTPVATSKVLVKNQTNGDNGVWLAQSGAWVRQAFIANAWANVTTETTYANLNINGGVLNVINGTVNKNLQFQFAVVNPSATFGNSIVYVNTTTKLPVGSPNNRFVDVNIGNDTINNGSSAFPFATVAKAIVGMAYPGIINIASSGGTETSNITLASGNQNLIIQSVNSANDGGVSALGGVMTFATGSTRNDFVGTVHSAGTNVPFVFQSGALMRNYFQNITVTTSAATWMTLPTNASNWITLDNVNVTNFNPIALPSFSNPFIFYINNQTTILPFSGTGSASTQIIVQNDTEGVVRLPYTYLGTINWLGNEFGGRIGSVAIPSGLITDQATLDAVMGWTGNSNYDGYYYITGFSPNKFTESSVIGKQTAFGQTQVWWGRTSDQAPAVLTTIGGTTYTNKAFISTNTITASLFSGDGGGLSNISAANITGSYSDSNVSTYLASGNNSAGFTTTGNISAARLESTGNLSVIGESSVLGNATFSSNVSVTSNVSASYFIGNGSQLTGLNPANAITNGTSSVTIPTSGGNIISAVAGANVAKLSSSQIALGLNSGTTAQLANSVAIGVNAGATNQQLSAVAIGTNAGQASQGANSVAIGTNAGALNNAANSVSIGANATAGYSSVVLNATGANLSDTGAGFFVAPVRSDAANLGNIAIYNTSTKEVRYATGNAIFNNYLPNYTGNLDQAGNITAVGNISGAYIIGNGSQLTGLPPGYTNSDVANYMPSYTGNLGNVNIITASGNISGANLSTAGSVTATGNISGGNVTVADAVTATGVITGSSFVAGNVANATSTKIRIANFGTNSYVQTGNGTSGSTGNIIFSPYADATPKVVINTGTGNITANNLGNVSSINITGSITQFLSGNGTWETPTPGAMKTITKITPCGDSMNFMLADGRVFVVKDDNTGGQPNYCSALGEQNNGLLSGINNCYEIVFPDEIVGSCTDAGIYGVSAYALFASGNLYTWGYGGQGQLGLGDTADRTMPTLSNTSVSEVYCHTSTSSANSYYTRLIIKKTNNTYWGCGYDGQYQLGLGSNSNKIFWTQLTWILPNALSVWNLGAYVGALVVQQANGDISVTGYNAFGQLGIGNTTQPTFAVNAPNWTGNDLTMRIKNISFGSRFSDGGTYDFTTMTMFLDNGTTSRLVGSGSNNYGSLGIGNTTNQSSPIAPQIITGRIAKLTSVGAGAPTMYVLMTNGDLYTYGYNQYGQVGNGTTTNQLTPYKLFTGTCADLIGDAQGWLEYGYYSTSPLMKKTDGTYVVTGYNAYGQAGIGDARTSITTPTLVRLPKNSNIKFVGVIHCLNQAIVKVFITAENTIYATGWNSYRAIDATNAYLQLNTPVQFIPNTLRT